MRNLKRKAIVALLALFLIAGAPAWAAYFCSATLTDCGLMKCIPIPAGGYCYKTVTSASATITTYDSSGAIYQSVFFYCPGSMVQLPNLP